MAWCWRLVLSTTRSASVLYFDSRCGAGCKIGTVYNCNKRIFITNLQHQILLPREQGKRFCLQKHPHRIAFRLEIEQKFNNLQLWSMQSPEIENLGVSEQRNIHCSIPNYIKPKSTHSIIECFEQHMPCSFYNIHTSLNVICSTLDFAHFSVQLGQL